MIFLPVSGQQFCDSVRQDFLVSSLNENISVIPPKAVKIFAILRIGGKHVCDLSLPHRWLIFFGIVTFFLDPSARSTIF